MLELEATDISFGKVADSALTAAIPSGAKVDEIDMGARTANRARRPRQGRSGVKDVAAKLAFALTAPRRARRPAAQGRAADQHRRQAGALVTYGAGLGGSRWSSPRPSSGQSPATRRDRGAWRCRASTIPGTTGGQELATALGTLVSFQRDGVQYIVVGSVTPMAAESGGPRTEVGPRRSRLAASSSATARSRRSTAST